MGTRVDELVALLAVSGPQKDGRVPDTVPDVRAALSAAPGDWWRRAGCRGSDPNVFFPESGQSAAIAAALATCEACPVRAPCLAYALASPQKPGVWGGSTVNDRRRLRRLLAQGAA